MKPVVVIESTPLADAFRYSRFANGESTHIVETPSTPVGEPRVTLSAVDVEWMRNDPVTFFKEG